MSHALDFSKGKAAIAYNAKNGLPWHGYGEHILPTDSPEEITRKAGIDYDVLKAPVIYYTPNPNYDPKDKTSEPMTANAYENKAVLYRSDNGDHLGIMSESHYTPAQPIDLVKGLMQFTETGDFEMDVCGALKGGTVVWALLKRVGGQYDVGKAGKADMVNQYLLATTSYNGTIARQGRTSQIRTVCNNTLTATLGERDTAVAKQRNSTDFDIVMANKLWAQLGALDAQFAELVERQKAMTNVRMTDDKLKRFFAKLYAPKAFKDENLWEKSELDWDRDGVTSNQQNNIADLLNIFRDSPGSELPSANGTLWGALNSVTYYQDHAARTKGDKRWESATYGVGANRKDAALELALQLI